MHKMNCLIGFMYPLCIVFGNEALKLGGGGILHGLEEPPAVLSAVFFYTKFGTNTLLQQITSHFVLLIQFPP